jgi:hypothetical protein
MPAALDSTHNRLTVARSRATSADTDAQGGALYSI